MTWTVDTDFLRCNPLFFNNPWYDFVIIDTEKKNIFARLIFVFAIWIDDNPQILALIQPFDAYLGPTRRKDEELGLWRVGMRPRSSSEFIFIKSIIRGAVLVEDLESEKDNEYLVMDLIDQDMFLCCKEIYGGSVS